MAACSSSVMPSNSAGSPLGKEKIWVTCTPATCTASTRPTSGETIEPPSFPTAP